MSNFETVKRAFNALNLIETDTSSLAIDAEDRLYFVRKLENALAVYKAKLEGNPYVS